MVQVHASDEQNAAPCAPGFAAWRSLRCWRAATLCVLLAACAWPGTPTMGEPAQASSVSEPGAMAGIEAPPVSAAAPAPAVPLPVAMEVPEAASSGTRQTRAAGVMVAAQAPSPVAGQPSTTAGVDVAAVPAEGAEAGVAGQPAHASAVETVDPAPKADMPDQVRPMPAPAAASAPSRVQAALAGPWVWLLWVLLALAVLAVLLVVRQRHRARPEPRRSRPLRDTVSPSIRWARVAPAAPAAFIKVPGRQARESIPLRAGTVPIRRLPATPQPVVAAPLPATPQPATPMESTPVSREPASPQSEAAVAARPMWTLAGTQMSLRVRWAATQGEQMIWDDWMSSASVDMGEGCQLQYQDAPAVAATVAAPDAIHAPTAATCAPPPPLPQDAVPTVSAAKASAPAAAERGAAVAPAEPLPFARRVQALLDDTAGAGLLRVHVVEGSEVPQLELLVPSLPAAAASALFSGINRMSVPELARWLQVQVILASRFNVQGHKPERIYEHAVELTLPPARTGSPSDADWQAVRIQLHLAWLQQQGRASRMHGLSRMRHAVAELDQRDSLPVQLAWLQVLQWWGSQQQGDAGLQRFDEAEAVCVRLAGHPQMVQESQRLLAETLLLRARQEVGGIREASLRRAETLAAQVYALSDTAAAALTVAGVALARAELAEPAQALPLLEQALAHAFLAGREPALEAASLQTRLAIQLAYEALGNVPAPQQVAQDLADRLQGTALLAAETWRRIVDVHLRREQFQLACQMAAKAASQHRLRPDLIALWERASAAWKAQGLRDEARTAWQENVRARQAASAQL